MYFDNYKEHQDSRIRKSLLWEYDLTRFDWNSMQTVVLQRVIERGRLEDFYAAINLYGLKEFKEGVKNIPNLCKKDIAFVCTVFGIKKQELKCYSRSLQIGHRISVDLDLFSNISFDEQVPKTYEDVRLAGFEDLAAMKLNAIIGNGTRLKDFIDIAYISTTMTLNQMLRAYQEKYSSNGIMVLKALSFFDEINFDEPIIMSDMNKFDWKKIKKHLLLMIKFPDKIFDKIV